jgi:predicted Na+-dependent transporter
MTICDVVAGIFIFTGITVKREEYRNQLERWKLILDSLPIAS